MLVTVDVRVVVFIAVGVEVDVPIGVNVGVTVAVGVTVGVLVGGSIGVSVGVSVGVNVAANAAVVHASTKTAPRTPHWVRVFALHLCIVASPRGNDGGVRHATIVIVAFRKIHIEPPLRILLYHTSCGAR